MTTLKQGDLIKDGNGAARKVMETCGIILHLSTHYDHSKYLCTTDEASLKEMGYTWDTPAWEPDEGKAYWFITSDNRVEFGSWHNYEVDRARRDFPGIYQTKERANAALLEIRRKLGK